VNADRKVKASLVKAQRTQRKTEVKSAGWKRGVSPCELAYVLGKSKIFRCRIILIIQIQSFRKRCAESHNNHDFDFFAFLAALRDSMFIFVRD